MMPELQTVFIYALKDPRDGAVRYIGKANDPRARLGKHFYEAKKGKDKNHKNRWVRLLLSVGIPPEMEILDEVPSSQQSFFERAYIKAYRELGAKLTNSTDGGEGSVGFKHSEETIKSMTGRKYSPERGANISKALTGKVHSPETRAKQSAARKGVPKTREHRASMSKAQKGRIHSEESNRKRSATLVEYYAEHESPTLGYKHTPETCAKMSASRKGQRPSEAAISAARAVTKGVPKSAEHNAKNSEALKRVWAARKAKNVVQ